MTKEIQKAVCEYLAEKGHEHICENFGHGFEMDVAYLSKSGMLHEIEVKVSRSDFLADKNKGRGIKKFDRYATIEFNSPNYFYYACPKDLISVSEIPHYAGLFYYSDGKVELIRNCKRLHQQLQDKVKILSKMLRMTVQRKYLGGCLMTIQNKRIVERNNLLLNS